MSFRRLPAGGTAIDRSRPLSFSFDGQRYCGFEGDTLASALLANGVILFGRSFKYHRPRGLFAAGAEEPNALVTLTRNGLREPNLKATEVEVFEGLTAESQNRFPSLAFDISAVNALAGKLFSAGFYYKTFMGPFRNTKFWMLCEKFIRRAAGLGKAGLVADPDRYERMNAFCDVLIVGAGPAGLKAAETAAASGLDVMLADENPQIGGALRHASGEINEQAMAAFTTSFIATLAGFPNLRILTRTHVWGCYDGNTLAAVERVADHKSSRRPGEPRQRHWVIRAKQVILATGAIERPIVFPGNDVPGVMLADALVKYAQIHAAAPKGEVVLFTNNDTAYHAALDLKRLGVAVSAIIDLRGKVSGFAQLLAPKRWRGIDCGTGSRWNGRRQGADCRFHLPLQRRNRRSFRHCPCHPLLNPRRLRGLVAPDTAGEPGGRQAEMGRAASGLSSSRADAGVQLPCGRRSERRGRFDPGVFRGALGGGIRYEGLGEKGGEGCACEDRSGLGGHCSCGGSGNPRKGFKTKGTRRFPN